MPSVLHHIAFVVADPPRTSRIFEALFGALAVLPGAAHRGPPEVSVHMRGLTMVLVKGEPPSQRTDSHVAFAVQASDLASHKAKLAQLGIEAIEPRQGPPGRALYFVDYDNYLYELNAEPLL